MKKIRNREASNYAQNREEFIGNNLMGVDRGNVYVVYSYGYWILHMYDKLTKQWYICTERYSVTTSKHYGQSNPSRGDRSAIVFIETQQGMLDKFAQLSNKKTV